MNIRESTASAPGKIILFGEHFVVYGNPAILMAVNMRLNVYIKVIHDGNKIHIQSDSRKKIYDQINIKFKKDKLSFFDPIIHTCRKIFDQEKIQNVGLNIKINSDIPNGIGLGSSGAVSVATNAAILSIFKKPNKTDIFLNASETEKLIHKYSSGADCLISTVGGLVLYKKNQKYRRINYNNKFSFLIIDTGIKHSTKKMVEKVKKFSERENERFIKIKETANQICNDAIKTMKNGDEIGTGLLIRENHKLLEQIGISNVVIEKIIKKTNDAGAFGSKLTGAGGGGSIISLVPIEEKERIKKRIENQGYRVFPVIIDNQGVLIKKIVR